MARSISNPPVEPLSQGWRIAVLFLNLGLGLIIYFLATGSIIPSGSGASVWLLASLAHWLLTLVAAPFFLPPRDSLSTAIAVVLMLAPIQFMHANSFDTAAIFLNWVGIVVALAVALSAIVAIFQQNNGSLLSNISYRFSSTFGKGEILFTLAVLVSAIGFYQEEIGWLVTILVFWTLAVTIKPVELIIRFALYLRGMKEMPMPVESVGTILRVDDPAIVRITLTSGTTAWDSDTAYIATLPNGQSTYILPLFLQIQDDEMIGTGICCECPDGIVAPTSLIGNVYEIKDETLAATLGSKLSGEDAVSKVIGIVSEGSAIGSIKFQVVRDTLLEEGSVVFAYVRGKKVHYQILDANTREESFQQNPYGVHVASAAQLGCYDIEAGFKKFPWLPDMNQPLFLASTENAPAQELKDNEFMIGQIPATPFGLPVILDDLIEYHAAVLGITGTGKTELTLDIIREALKSGTKVFCVDFTGEYMTRLSDQDPEPIGLSIDQGSELEGLLFAVETGEFGAKKERAALQAFLDAVKPQVATQIEDFLTEDESRLGIFELSEITNTKATLRTTELYLSAIMDWARRNRKTERVLIVLEEAHTIIPEAYSSGFDSDTQWVVGRIGQIALQGRKYGVGLLLVSQRTALVSKTVLSQCNTYFTHALVDKTSLDYLSGVYSPEHVRAIPNLRFLEFLAHGKAVKSEQPILVRRLYDADKLAASKALDVPKVKKDLSAEAAP